MSVAARSRHRPPERAPDRTKYGPGPPPGGGGSGPGMDKGAVLTKLFEEATRALASY